MQNKAGFIPQKYLQPDYYKNCFNAWCGVYIHPTTDKEYHLQLVLDYFDFDCKTVRYIEILQQNKTCRTDVAFEKFLSMKSAIEYLEKHLLK